MQTLLNPHPISFLPPKTTLNPNLKPYKSLNHNPLSTKFTIKAFSADEFPIDEEFLHKFGPKDVETEDEARRRNWIEAGWAPWEEILTPEADFARKSLNEGEEVELTNPDTIEAFRMLKPSYRKNKMEELGLTEDEFYAKQFEIKGEVPEPLETLWAGPMVVRHVPPRDWPPRGWEVDREELEFIREAHRFDVRVGIDQVVNEARKDIDGLCLDRYKVFLKQYNQWVEANRDRLEEESYKETKVRSPPAPNSEAIVRNDGDKLTEGGFDLERHPGFHPAVTSARQLVWRQYGFQGNTTKADKPSQIR